MTIRAVTFDYWNTLIAETDAPLQLRKAWWLEILGEEGVATTEDVVMEAFKAAWGEFDRRWRRNEQSSAVSVAAHAVDHLPTTLGPDVRARLVEAYLQASLSVPRELLPDVADSLERLRILGMGVGVVCDVGTVGSEHLRRWLRELGVADLVDHFSFSDEVGVFKPDPLIFQHALGGLGGVSPAEAAHVGDLRRTDVAGARSSGMISVRYTGAREDTDDEHPEAHHIISQHPQLFDVLDID